MSKKIYPVLFIILGACMAYQAYEQNELTKLVLIMQQNQSGLTYRTQPETDNYMRGFNDALEHIALVNLEYAVLKNEPKTFGELADICRERRGFK